MISIRNDTKNMNQIIVNIPDDIEMNSFDVKMIIATKLFEEGKLSSGQAAKIVGLSKRTFIELLGKYDISVIGYDFEELELDMENV